MPMENPIGNEPRGGRVGGCFGHPPCLLLNLGGAPFFFYLRQWWRFNGFLFASPSFPLTSFTASSDPVAAHLSAHSSSGMSYYRLQLTPLAMSVWASRLFIVFVLVLSSKKESCSPVTDFIPPFSSDVIVEFGNISLYLKPIPSRSNSSLHYYSRTLLRWHYYVRTYFHYLLPRLCRLVWL